MEYEQGHTLDNQMYIPVMKDFSMQDSVALDMMPLE
jgi:hypothetical protein